MAGYKGLGKQTVTVRLGGGIDQANDPFLSDAPSVAEAENVRFDDRGALSKRSGHTQYSQAGTANSVLDIAGTLGVWGPGGAWQRDEIEDVWLSMNECAPRPSRVLTDAIVRGNDSLSRADFAMVGSLGCVVWENDTEETVHYQFVDFSSGRPQVLARRALTTIKSSPRILITSGKDGVAEFVIVGMNGAVDAGGTLYCAVYDYALGTYTFGSPNPLGITIGTSGASMVWDVCSQGIASPVYVVISNPAGSDCLFSACDGGTVVTSELATNFHGYACTVNLASNDVVAVGTNEDGIWAYIADAPYMLASPPAVAALATLENSDDNVRRATICQLDAAGKMFAAFSGRRDVQTSSSTEYGLGTDIVEISAAYASLRGGFVRSMAIAAKARYAIAFGTADALLPLCENATELALEGEGPALNSPTTSPAPVGLLCRPEINVDGDYTVAVAGRFLVDAIAKASDDWHLSHVAALDDDAYFVATVLTDVGGPLGAVLRKTQIDLVRANVFAAPPVRSVTSQGLRLAAGGAGLVCFDGGNVVECTPHMVTVIGRAEQDTDYGSSSTTTEMPDPGDEPEGYDGGTGSPGDPPGYVPRYPIRLVHVWTDAKGNIHRGAPSDPYFLVPTRDGSLNLDPPAPSMMIGFSAGEPTAMNGDRLQLMDVEVYQAAQPDRETWHRIATCKPRAHPTVPGWLSITALNPSVALEPSHGFRLREYDTLSSYPALYTDSEAANIPPPPLLDLCSTQSRLWGLSAEKRLDVFYTKPIVSGVAPAFYGASTPVPAEGGEAVGIAALDDKVVVFKERLVFVLFGDPGDAMGDGSTLQTPRLVSGDVGCINALSIVEGPFGVAFLSERGFYTIDRGMSFSFIGEPVKDVLGGETVTSGVLVPSQSEVRWTFGTDGQALVWNFLTNAWSLWSGFTASHAALWRGAHTRVSSSGAVYVETPDAWTAGSLVDVVITTAWLKLSGLQRYARIRRALFLARHYSGGVRIEVGYDYAPEWVDSVEWTETELEALRASDGRVQLEVNQSIQKCEAIRYRITALTADGQQGFYPGQAIDLVGIDMELGVKPGTFRNIAADSKR